MGSALQNIKVLDLSRVLAGPWATQLLGDYGADVVKVERPGSGDDTRHWGPPWLGSESAYFLCTNRNKRSITIDISCARGQELVRALAREADILIENFRVGTMARFGLDYDTLAAANPRLIYCSISAYGQSGSRAHEPGYDAMIQGEGGLMSITGPADTDDGGPQKVGVAIADIMTGMYATSAILAAVCARSDSGRGQQIDVPLYDTQVAWLANQGMNYLVGGTVPVRMGTAHPNLVPYQAFATSDGNMMLAVGNDRQFAAAMGVLELGQLATDELFATNAARVASRQELVRRISERLATGTTSMWLAAFAAADVPAGPINDIGQVLDGAYARERELVGSLENKAGDSVPTVRNPVRFEDTPAVYAKAPPLLGEHTEEVLRDWLGYSPEQVEALREEAAI
jgi:formyl-CoA transferase